MNIYLIGYRCTGKTSAGRLLSRKTGRLLVDTDQQVAARAGMHVSEIVARHGWPFFRDMEKQALQETTASSRLVVATGGGIILSPENRAILADPAHFTVWLCAPAETIEKRMKEDRQTRELRPALTEDFLSREIAGTLAERNPYYEAAGDMAIDTDQRSVEEVCELILKERPNVRQHLW
jgi:shikimate kinase